jgi:hypothetical protein
MIIKIESKTTSVIGFINGGSLTIKSNAIYF